MQPFNRRVMLSGGMVAGMGASASMALPSGVTPDASGASATIHQVFFWLKNAGSEADRDQLIAGLRTLAAIDVIQRFHIGVPASTEKRDVVDNSYDVSELMFFRTVEDQKTYQDHPVHLKFVENFSHLWKRVVVYDSMSV